MPAAPSLNARIAAAKIVLSAAGHTLEAKLAAVRHPTDTDKPLHQMTLAELQDAMRGAEANLARARGVVLEVESQTDPADTDDEEAE